MLDQSITAVSMLKTGWGSLECLVTGNMLRTLTKLFYLYNVGGFLGGGCIRDNHNAVDGFSIQ